MLSKYVLKTGGGILVITEGVFGMAGDLGNIPGIVEKKARFTFRLLVDDVMDLVLWVNKVLVLASISCPRPKRSILTFKQVYI